MKTTELTHPSPSPLPAAEWNFDTIPNNELIACCYWEYARESAFICNTLKEYRDWILAGSEWSDRAGKMIQNLESIHTVGRVSEVFVRGCSLSHDRFTQSANPKKPNYRHPHAPPITGKFPAPWQLLSEPERKYRSHIRSRVEQFQIVPIKLSHWGWAKEIARECKRTADARHEARKNWEAKYLTGVANGNSAAKTNAPPAPEFQEIRPRTRWGVGETLMVDIAWECFTNDQIVNYFRQWVKAARPKEVPAPSDRGHKPGDWRAKLTRLAVMRLLSHSSASKLFSNNGFPAVWKTKQFSASKWGDSTKWYTARREARKIFNALFPFVPKNEKPRSWSRRESSRCER